MNRERSSQFNLTQVELPRGKVKPGTPERETYFYEMCMRLVLNASIECCTSAESGRVYFTRVEGRKDGLKGIDYWPKGEQVFLNYSDREERIDGVKDFEMHTQDNRSCLVFYAETVQAKKSVLIFRDGVSITEGEWVLRFKP